MEQCSEDNNNEKEKEAVKEIKKREKYNGTLG